MSQPKQVPLGSSTMAATPKVPLSEIINLNDFETAAEANLKPKVSTSPEPRRSAPAPSSGSPTTEQILKA